MGVLVRDVSELECCETLAPTLDGHALAEIREVESRGPSKPQML